MVSASLIGCGILSLVQMSRIRLWGNYRLGTGLLTVVGTSFATLSTAFSVSPRLPHTLPTRLLSSFTLSQLTHASAWQIFGALYANGTCPTTVVNGVTVNGPCPDAYGILLGTSLVCSFLEMGMSFVPVRILQRVFPPIVTGTVILMIGASLVGSSGESLPPLYVNFRGTTKLRDAYCLQASQTGAEAQHASPALPQHRPSSAPLQGTTPLLGALQNTSGWASSPSSPSSSSSSSGHRS